MFSPHPEKKQPPWFSFGILGIFGSDKKTAFQIQHFGLFFWGGGETRCRQKKGGTKKNDEDFREISFHQPNRGVLLTFGWRGALGAWVSLSDLQGAERPFGVNLRGGRMLARGQVPGLRLGFPKHKMEKFWWVTSQHPG